MFLLLLSHFIFDNSLQDPRRTGPLLTIAPTSISWTPLIGFGLPPSLLPSLQVPTSLALPLPLALI